MTTAPQVALLANPPPTTLAGWDQHVQQAPPSVDTPTRDAWTALPGRDRSALARRRTEAASTVVVPHPHYDTTLRQARELLHYNSMLPRGTTREGLVIDGVPMTGKTTLAKRIGHEHTLRERARYADGLLPPPTKGFAPCPTVYVSLRQNTGHRELVRQLLDFFTDTSRMKRTSAEHMYAMFEAQARARNVSLVIINDLHQVNAADSLKRTPTYALKSILEDIEATLIGTANHATSVEGVFAHGRHTCPTMIQQISGRLRRSDLPPYDLYRPTTSPPQPDDRLAWGQVVVDLEARSGLIDHEPNDLREHTDELWELAGGRVGKLAAMFRQAVLLVIADSVADPTRPERLTIGRFRTLHRDHDSEQLPNSWNKNDEAAEG